MKNNSHGESKKDRLKRFQENAPYEVISTLINSIANFFNNELRITTQDNNYQTTLMVLGVHASALTISEALFNKSGHEGYKLFLEKFVDGETPDTKFSTIAQLIHDWRNVIAHQWIGSIGHEIGYDYVMTDGWKTQDDVTFINPRIYLEQYLKAFGPGGKIWSWGSVLTDQEKQDASNRLIVKYLQK